MLTTIRDEGPAVATGSAGERRRVRVLVLIDTLAFGGAERFSVDVACSLDRSAFEPHVVAIKHGGPLEADLDTAQVPYTILSRRRRTSLGPAIALLGLARRTDLIHSHLFGNNVWGAIFARAAGVPLVAHEHNRVDAQSRFERPLDRWLIGRTAGRILCVSETAAQPLRAAGVDPELIEIVPNGVRLTGPLPPSQARLALGLADDAIVVGIVASLRPEKAHVLLMRAFARLVRPGGRDRLRLCIVGDGSERRRLETLADDLGIDDRVIWAGARADANRLPRAFDVSVLCSRSEGLPLAALESMAAGVPLVATRVGALPAILQEDAGILVDPGDEEGLAQAIGELLDDPPRRRALGVVGARRVAECFDVVSVVRRVEGVYRLVLGDAGGGRWSFRGGRGFGSGCGRLDCVCVSGSRMVG